jgi:hypothetical protein
MKEVLSVSFPFLLNHMMDSTKNYENLQKFFKSLKQYKADHLISDVYEVLIALDPSYKKILGQTVISDITGVKIKRGFDLFKREGRKDKKSDGVKESTSREQLGKK